jgi:mRNA-degrading endonuclease RelE of RelBE toxin-antitoxin system
VSFDLLGGDGFHRELERLSEGDQLAVLEALSAMVDNPLGHPQKRRVEGTPYPGSFLLRVDSWRVLGSVLASQDLILLTALFHDKRPSDHDKALRRHYERLATAGPPLGVYVRKAKR